MLNYLKPKQNLHDFSSVFHIIRDFRASIGFNETHLITETSNLNILQSICRNTVSENLKTKIIYT